MDISRECRKSQRAYQISRDSQENIHEYCDKYAAKRLGIKDFSFHALPDCIVESIFYGSEVPPEGFAVFLKKTIDDYLAGGLCGFELAEIYNKRHG